MKFESWHMTYFWRIVDILFSGSTPNVNSIGDIQMRHMEEKPATYGEMIVEKIHGIGEKLLGHHRSDSDCSTRGKTGKYSSLLKMSILT